MIIYNFENGFFKNIEVKLGMKIFMRGEDYETSYEEKEEHVKKFLKRIVKDNDIVEVFDIEVLDVSNG